MADGSRVPPRVRGGITLALAALAVFLILWFPVILGQRVLLGGDILYGLLPWAAEPGAHPPANPIVNDPIVQMLPWQQLVAQEIGNGQLPLWNPNMLSGVPLLANDATAAFSPFTWFALPFPAGVGLSLAMLLKVLVAASGMAFYLRTLKASGTAAALGGVAYAASSFMVIWLAWPQAGVAALMPFSFAFVELYLRGKAPWAISGLALAFGLQFLAGNAETSLHLSFALGLYSLIRWAWSGHAWRSLAGLVIAAGLGTMLAGIQLIPFLDLLRHATLLSARSTTALGFEHLGRGALSSWVFPNILGNPGIDGRIGRLPNFNESTGFVGVAVLVLSPLGAWWTWKRERSAALGLVVVGLVSAAIAYGPLTPLLGRLPGLANSNNTRLLVVICFCLAALGGLGLDAVLQAPRWRSIAGGRAAACLGGAGLVAIAGAGLAVLAWGQRVDRLLPTIHGYIGFWLAVGAISLFAALAFVVSGFFGGQRRVAAAGLCALAILEAAIFAGPFNPREPLDQLPPHSPSLTWLQAHAGARPVAGLDTVLIPETASLYGLTDVRGYEILIDPREQLFWSTADPGYSDVTLILTLDRPGVDWLAAAGVAYVMMPADRSLPGTTVAFSEPGVVIAEVPNPRPFAFAATAVASASGPDQAAALLAQAPLGPVVVEGCCPLAGAAEVAVTRRGAGFVDLDVNAQSQATVVIEQSFQPGWVATIDGRPATLLPANVLFQAVSVPAGAHHVALRYQPSSVTIGGLSSALGAAALVLLVLVPLAWRRRARPG